MNDKHLSVSPKQFGRFCLENNGLVAESEVSVYEREALMTLLGSLNFFNETFS